MASSTLDDLPGRPHKSAAVSVSAPDRERFLAAIVDSAEDCIFAKALDATILTWNAAAQRMYGYTPEEIVGRRVHALAPPDRQTEIDEIMDRIRAGQRIEHFESERIRKNGERFPVSLSISPVRDANDRIIGASTIARDISEQRRLVDSSNFQRSLLGAQSEASLDGIVVLDQAGSVLFANRRFGELWQLDDASTEDRTARGLINAMRRLIADPQAFLERVRELSERPADIAREELRLVDGRVLDTYSAPVLGENGRYYGRVWTFRDVTPEAERRAQLRAMIEAVEDAAFVCSRNGVILLRNPAGRVLMPGAVTFDDIDGRPGRRGAGYGRRRGRRTT